MDCVNIGMTSLQPRRRQSSETSKLLRAACDRCHTQKLRCVKSSSLSNLGECERCLKAVTPCTFSPASRFGRKSASLKTQLGQSTTGHEPPNIPQPDESLRPNTIGFANTNDVSFNENDAENQTSVDISYSNLTSKSSSYC